MGRGFALAIAWLCCWVAGAARADDLLKDMRARTTVGGAMMVSASQVDRLAFDRGGLNGAVQLGYAPVTWFEGHLTLAAAVFPRDAAAGGLLASAVGFGVNTTNDDVRVYGHLDAGLGFTGALTRPYVRAATGVDLRVMDWLTLGPVIGYDHIFQHDGQYASTDARFVWIGLSITLQANQPQTQSHDTATHSRRTTHVTRTRVVRTPPVVTTEPSAELMELIDRTLPSTKVEVHMLAPVLFRFDSDTLQPIGVAMLHEVARELSQRPELELVEIQGAADTRGNAEYNVSLSARRAQRVFDWLVAHGIAAERLRVAAQGASTPVEVGEDEAQHEQNRRVVFRVIRMKETP